MLGPGQTSLHDLSCPKKLLSSKRGPPVDMANADAPGEAEALQCNTVLGSVCRQPVAETELIADSWD